MTRKTLLFLSTFLGVMLVGAVAFAACVLLSLLASAAFDPHVIWEQRPG